MIVGIDAGKYQTRAVYPLGSFSFKSKLYPYRPLRLENKLGKNDLIIEYQGEKYLGGDLGEREGEIPISHTDESKAHLTTLINLLSALHRLPDVSFKIVIGSPISKRTDVEKAKIKEMVTGTHKIALNGNERVIRIENCEVSPEGAAGFWSEPVDGEIQGLDFGSTTTNYFYMRDRKFVDRLSDTFPYGYENSVTKDAKGIIRAIHSQLANKFKDDNPTMLMGGKGQEFHPIVQEFYPRAYVVKDPIFATAQGFFQIARTVYG